MTENLARLLHAYQGALLLVEGKRVFWVPVAFGSRARLPVPAVWVRSFAHISVYGHIEHLKRHLSRRYAVDWLPSEKESVERLSVFIETVPKKRTRPLILTAAIILVILAFAFFSLAEISQLFKLGAAIVGGDAAKALEEVRNTNAGGYQLLLRFAGFLALTYGCVHVPLWLAFRAKQNLLDSAPAPPQGSSAISPGEISIDNLRVLVSTELGVCPRRPDAFDLWSKIVVFCGYAMGPGGFVLYLAAVTGAGWLWFVGLMNLAIGVGVALVALAQIGQRTASMLR